MKLELTEANYYYRVKHSHIGKLSVGYIFSNFTFTSGCNVMKGNYDKGCWTISYAIATCKKFSYKNSNEISIKKLKERSYYIGNIPKNLRIFYKINTVEQLIRRGIKKSKTDLSYEWIVSSLQLEPMMLKKSLLDTGKEIWIYSVAIGLANGKKIFCFPWLSNNDLKGQSSQIDMIARIVKKLEFIAILPVESTEIFNKDNSDYVFYNKQFLYPDLDC